MSDVIMDSTTPGGDSAIDASTQEGAENPTSSSTLDHHQINKKVCLMIIDSGSCTKVISTLLIENLGLPTTKHSHPYRLQ